MPRTQTLDTLLDQLSSTFGISDAEFARILGTSVRTIERWRDDLTYPQHESRKRLDELDKLADRLAESFTDPKGARLWLHANNGYFGGLKPIDALIAGRVDAVDAALEALDSGIFV